MRANGHLEIGHGTWHRARREQETETTQLLLIQERQHDQISR